MVSNFDFLSGDQDQETTEFLATLKMAEDAYRREDYEGTLTKVRKVAENTASLIAGREGISREERASFNEVLSAIKEKLPDKHLVDAFYDIKGKGNKASHELNPEDATKENALEALEQIFGILIWVMQEYINPNIKKCAIGQFSEPIAQPMYRTTERKFIYVQTVDNDSGLWPAYEGTQKIGEASVSKDLEADWRPNSDYLRTEASKRIDQYMKTAGPPYTIGWAELACRKAADEIIWFHDHDVHEVLERSEVKRAENLEGTEWFETDLETAKSAIKAVKDGRHSLQETVEETEEIELRPEQYAAVKQTEKVFKKKDRMLWNAKMRFGKTLTALQLVKNQAFNKVLIVTHRPVVEDSWSGDFKKMQMAEAGYDFGSVAKGETLYNLKKGDKPFVYFASIQLLRHDNGQTNLKDFADVDWDLIIIDEAHEGTQTELSSTVMKNLVKGHTKLLELSGTPFNLLDQFDEEQVYTWDYVMEQQAKTKRELENPGQPNPYESLPKVSMYTFEMKHKEHFSDESKSFNFKEFFRVDEDGQLVYKREVRQFLDNITNPDSQTNYPFSTPAYREELRHTLWLMPGVKEANAFEALLKEHPIFGKEYTVVNVVRGKESDDGVANADDIDKVRQAITDDPSQTKTITLTVRRLTTGVNIPEWTAVLFLSNTNSAANYLQAAFRAQTPFSHEKLGMKTNCYIFDFAPDRALTVMAEAAQINSGVGKQNTQQQKDAMNRLLNFMPILGSSDQGMTPYSVDKMLTQLKKVYAEKAVRSGFEDDSLYNDKLLTLTADDASMFNKLNAIVGKTQSQKTPKEVVIADNGLTDEEYERAEKGQKKPKQQRTDEEKEAIEKQKEAKKQRKTMISILRGVSIRIPMMIYGMSVDLAQDITIDDFIHQVDEASWKEFMPKGFTKGMFAEITKYYDADVFIEAGRIIRQRAKSFDSLDFIERAQNIAELFGSFKNPDKETVLTPWRVVNMQTAKSVGGLNFYDDDFTSTTNGATSNLHWVEKDNTKDIYYPETKILDINSKTGLYPLHAAISLYYQKVMANDDSHFEADKVYQDILANQIYAVAKTPMAKTITERTLTGYRNYKTNVTYIENLTDTLKTDLDAGKQAIEEAFKNVKFDVVIGNPPYQESATDKEMAVGQQQRVNNIFHLFQQLSDELTPNHSVLIYPGGRWMQQSGKGMKDFGRKLINSPQLSDLIYYPDANEIFDRIEISDGISIVHKNYEKKSNFFNYSLIDHGKEYHIERKHPGDGIFVIYPTDESIVQRIKSFVIDYNLAYLSESSTINQKLFQIESNFVELYPDKVEIFNGQDFNTKNQIKLLTNDKAGTAGRATWFIAQRDVIKVRQDLIDKWKVVVSSANAGGQKRDNQLEILPPFTAFGRSRLALKAFDTETEAINFYNFVRSKFIRFAFLLTDEKLSSLAKLVPDLLDYTNNQSLIDFNSDIDEQFINLLDLTSEEVQRINDRVNGLR